MSERKTITYDAIRIYNLERSNEDRISDVIDQWRADGYGGPRGNLWLESSHSFINNSSGVGIRFEGTTTRSDQTELIKRLRSSFPNQSVVHKPDDVYVSIPVMGWVGATPRPLPDRPLASKLVPLDSLNVEQMLEDEEPEERTPN